MLKKLFVEESGQDMVEYALLAAFISIVGRHLPERAGRSHVSRF
jgi:hypothetical protein